MTTVDPPSLLLIALVLAIVAGGTLVLCLAGTVGTVVAGLITGRGPGTWPSLALGALAGAVGGIAGILAVAVIDQFTPLMSAIAPLACLSAGVAGAGARLLCPTGGSGHRHPGP
jgi:hypothetical protein